MDQTPVHDEYNADLLRVIPVESSRLVEVGSSSGALARAFKEKSPASHYIGIDIDYSYSRLSRRYCDESYALDIERVAKSFWDNLSDRECWIFGDTLEHLQDPWRVLKNINAVIPIHGCVVACIPNAQHWSLQAKLSCGEFRYESSGLLDKTHLRWFTSTTINELFTDAGFRVEVFQPRIFHEPGRELFLPLIGRMAQRVGADPKIASENSTALQYIIRARPTLKSRP